MTLIKFNTPNRNVFDDSFAFPSVESLVENIFKNNFQNEGVASYVPTVNISENNEAFLLEFSSPGFKKEDFKIEIDNNILTVSAEHKAEKSEEGKTFTRKEFSYGSFKRSFNLPETANTEKIEAKYDSGILKLAIAKNEEAKVKPVKEIKIA